MAMRVKSFPLPIYLIGVVWLLYSFFLPLYRLFDYLVCGTVSLVTFFLVRALCPPSVDQVSPEEEESSAETPPQKTTGNPQLDQLMQERDRALSEMRRLNDSIQDQVISQKIDRLEDLTRRILDLVVKDPQKLSQIRRFMDYYLPTTLKILNAYDRMDSVGIEGDNIRSTKERVEQMMDTIVQAFVRQLDALFSEDALDVSTDITVMEQLLAREGLADSPPSASTQKDIPGPALEL